MAIPGVLMRLSEVALVKDISIPNIQATYSLGADDEETPSRNKLYFLSDITSLISSPSFYEADADSSWVICSFINGRDTAGTGPPQTAPHVLPIPPIPGSILVINGSTPRPDKQDDYHAWYDEEHGAHLTSVPGWRAARRYALAKVYGEATTADFYGFNFYDAENGLGGPAWKAGVTEWTLRIRSNAARPNLRRVWRVEETE